MVSRGRRITSISTDGWKSSWPNISAAGPSPGKRSTVRRPSCVECGAKTVGVLNRGSKMVPGRNKMRAGERLVLVAQAAILLFFCGSALGADSAAVSNEARSWRRHHEHEILQEFSDLLAIPNLANDAPNIQRNATVI